MKRQQQRHHHQQHTKMEITIHKAIEQHRFSRKLNGNKVGRGKPFALTYIDLKYKFQANKKKK